MSKRDAPLLFLLKGEDMGYTGYKRYSYDGPVEEFGKCVTQRWTASTVAPSEKKALSNLTYQYKKEFGKMPNAQIRLPGKLTVRG